MSGQSYPYLLINSHQCRQNIERMLHKARKSNTVFRPHFKTHQSIVIGSWFKEHGIDKITVSSIEMAIHFYQNGWNDITIAFPVNPYEVTAINKLSGDIKLNILCSDLGAFQLIAPEIKNETGFFIEIDNGYHRSGLDPASPDIEKILMLAQKNRNLVFKGFLSHEGQTYKSVSVEQVKKIHSQAKDNMLALKANYITDYPDVIISMGDTPSCSIVESFENIDEIRPGNFIFYDLMQLGIHSCKYEQISLVMVCPIAAVYPERRQLVVHGGAVHFSKEQLEENGLKHYGRIAMLKNNTWGRLIDGYHLTALSQEHGIIEWEKNVINNFKAGDLIAVVPVHSCLAADLMKDFYTTDGHKI